jgi:NTP pyrophosphatase (non-canonical NTP hydrolase)
MNEIYQKLIDKFGVEHQELILIEEMSELTKAIIKKRRGLEQNIAEELADTQILLDQMKILYPQWKSWEQIKINHIEQNIL